MGNSISKIQNSLSNRKKKNRFEATLILILIGLLSVILSYFLDRAGLKILYIRYPICLVFSYLVFIFSFWLWIRYVIKDVSTKKYYAENNSQNPKRKNTTQSDSWWGGIDLDLDIGELGVFLVIIAAIILGILFVATLPGILIEVISNEIIVLYVFSKLEIIDDGKVFIGIIKNSWIFFTILMVIVLGWSIVVSLIYPDATKFGDVVKEVFKR